MDFSLVVEGGSNGFASIVKGSYDLYNAAGGPQGYVDGLSSHQMLLWIESNFIWF